MTKVAASLPTPSQRPTHVRWLVFVLAGLTSWMAARLRERTNPGLSEAASFLRAVVALELAAAFPIIGWFLFVPLCIVMSLGAASLALIGGEPRRQPTPTREPAETVTAVGAADAA